MRPSDARRSTSGSSSAASVSERSPDALDVENARVCCHDGLGRTKCGIWIVTGIALWAFGIAIMTIEYANLQGQGSQCVQLNPEASSAPCTNVTRWCYFSPSPYTYFSPCTFMTVLGVLAIILPIIGLFMTWLIHVIASFFFTTHPAGKQGLYHMIYTGLFAFGIWLAAVVKFSKNNDAIKGMYQDPDMAAAQQWRDVSTAIAWTALALSLVQLCCAGIVLWLRIRDVHGPHDPSAPLAAPLWPSKRHLRTNSSQYQHQHQAPAPMALALPMLISNPTFSGSVSSPPRPRPPGSGTLPGLATPPGGTPRAPPSPTFVQGAAGASAPSRFGLYPALGEQQA